MKEKEESRTYEVVTGFCIGNGVNVWPGQVIELTEAEARRCGEDVQLTDKKVGPPPIDPKHRKAPAPRGIQNRDPK